MNRTKIAHYFHTVGVKAKHAVIPFVLLFSAGCKDYLDIVPDNIATVDHAFVNANMAEKYLFTCYSYLPRMAEYDQVALMACDEFWSRYPALSSNFKSYQFENIARGNQNVVDPALNYWDGLHGGMSVFIALRICNTFLENIGDVPSEGFKTVMLENRAITEREQWIAEVKFLKAFYHYWLLRMYGPIPLIRENLPTSASIEAIQLKREPVDTCFNYIVRLLDEAAADLPLTVAKPSTETGRITRAIALSIKAKVLVEAASDLFNGNDDYASFIDPDTQQPFFNQTKDNDKWVKAAEACREAVTAVTSAGFRLYEFVPAANDKVNNALFVQMSIRGAVTEPNLTLNREVIWLETVSMTSYLQKLNLPCLDDRYTNNYGWWISIAPSLKTAEMFYTEHGVPIDQDDEWMTSGKYASRYRLRTATDDDRYYIRQGEQTATLHFNREPRFYANLAFDRGLWFGNGRYDQDDQWTIRARKGEAANLSTGRNVSVTGYMCKKLINYQGEFEDRDRGDFFLKEYAWPVMRVADLYLLLAEALNEAYGPSPEVYQWIDLVRERAGLNKVEYSWQYYATASHKQDPADPDKLREIIRRERLIELAHEGHRYWDIRRWKKGKEMWHNQPIQAWDMTQEDAAGYYRLRTLFVQKFTTKDYLFPIREANLSVNPKLVQNPGW
jgi:hypothetical protein